MLVLGGWCVTVQWAAGNWHASNIWKGVLLLEENDALPKKKKKKLQNEAEIATDSPSSKFTYYFLQGKAQRKISAIHILDVLVLNGNDVRNQHFNQRYVGSGEVSFLYVSQND